MTTQSLEYDVVIVGGGIVGATLACALSKFPLTIAVLEAQRFQQESSSSLFDVRVSAINRASENIFKALDVWQSMVSQRINPYRKMVVWDANGEGAIHFDCKDISADNLGHIIENRVIQSALHERIKACENIHWHSSVILKALTQDAEGVTLERQEGSTYRCRLLIGADGRQSWVRQRAGIETRGWDYAQSAIVATVRTSLPHQATAWQRFLPTGPLAFLPLSEPHTSSIVWSTSPDEARQYLEEDEASFCEHLAAAFDYRLGRVETVTGRAIFPLQLCYAKDYVRPHIALIGDAAHTIHPLAGQGINLGLLDAASLAEVIGDAILQRRDYAALHILRRYERWRKGDNLFMIAAMEMFKRAFEWDVLPLRWIRNTALNVTDHFTFIKNFFTRRAMGLEGDLPKIAYTP